MRFRTRSSTVLLALAIVAAACSGGGDGGGAGRSAAPASTTTQPAPPRPAPAGDAFYTPPDPLPEGEPGDLIWSQAVDAPEGVVAWRVLYLSEAVDGHAIAVSGVVAAPDGPAPEGGRPVMTWAHGTAGTADRCAPSKGGVGPSVFALDQVARRGWVAVATDYEGLGTPGLHPYLVGESEGRGVLDIARAARQIGETAAANEVVVWGVSQGGHAALFAGEIAPRYAPDLDVRGVVAAAPPGDLTALGAAATAAASVPAYGGFLLMAAGGYQAAYGDVSLDELMPPDLRRRFVGVLEDRCTAGVFDFADANPVVFTQNPLDVDPWPDLLEENSVDGSRLEMPILILQGEADQIVPKGLTDELAKRVCADGVELEYRTFPGLTHGQEIATNIAPALDWAAARFAGTPPATTCGA